MNNTLIVWMYQSLFIHSPTEGRLGCLWVLAIMIKAAINIHVQLLVCTQHTCFSLEWRERAPAKSPFPALPWGPSETVAELRDPAAPPRTPPCWWKYTCPHSAWGSLITSWIREFSSQKHVMLAKITEPFTSARKAGSTRRPPSCLGFPGLHSGRCSSRKPAAPGPCELLNSSDDTLSPELVPRCPTGKPCLLSSHFFLII